MGKTHRNICGCGKGRFIGENVMSGNIPCGSCRQMNEIKDGDTVKTYPNKLSHSYQERISAKTIKK
ncbi:hypothetical protein QO206_13265 [Leeuwenhoekiella aequorea]|mgnify:CR=1 FL=1|uniref:hypothetical protein n=1 Tax=Leeuwenhoekiella aequorea TaxID=283736 RepID=UPI00352CD1C2|tara:strand:+ start:16140 stop:16337 length:198 start_codon:yes stop_codon:yes gene_type:complete